jgi:pimeloyl-ACP methyl ester carboxylesterase
MDDSSGMSPNDFSSLVTSYGTNLWIAQVTMLSGNLNGIATNTQARVEYEIQSRTNLLQTDWQSEDPIFGSEVTNWTPLSVAQNGRPILFLRLRSWASSDGSGIPDWWWLQYFGSVGGDPLAFDSYGWTFAQDFEAGYNPTVFHTPPAPQGLRVTYNTSTGMANVSWLPSPGPVTGYTVQDSDGQTFTFSATVTSFTDDVSSDAPYFFADYGPTIGTTFQVQAQYGANGNSAWSNPVALEQNTLSANIIPGPQGLAYLVVAAMPPNTAAIRLTRDDYYAEIDNELFGANEIPNNTNFNIPIINFTNGVCILPNNITPPDVQGYSFYIWFGQAIGTNGNGLSAATELSTGSTFPADGNQNSWFVLPYFDGRVQLKQNLIFQLRAATMDDVFHFSDADAGGGFPITYPATYVYSSFYSFTKYDSEDGPYYAPIMDAFLPFENNYLFKNFVFDSSKLDSGGHTTTGVMGNYSQVYFYDGSHHQIPDNLILIQPPLYQFPVPTVNGATISPLLATNQTRWLSTYPLDSAHSYLPEIGVTNEFTYSPQIYAMFGNASNYFGLHFLSAAIGYGSGAAITLNANGNTTQGGYFYPETVQPQLQIVEYDCWPDPSTYFNGVLTNGTDYPGMDGLSLTHTNPVFVTSVGNPYFRFSCYAKLALQNGYSGVYGYLQQYFDKAYQIDTNGIVTTNTTGVLSPYGQFFATQPGPVALVTMPDPDTGARGTCIVNCLSLALDLNNDGIMDLSFSGPDTTSVNRPFLFWIDNNFDRFTTDSDDGVQYDDDVSITSQDAKSLYTGKATPDYDYRDGAGHRVISCERDLQDFTRLWVCGITSNLLATLPAGSTITLSWADIWDGAEYTQSGNPTIDLFAAADADGGMGYLTNSSTAGSQIDSLYCPYIGRLGPGSSLQLNASTFANHWAGNHFIWCGVSSGTGGLNLTIADGSGNVLGQTTAYIQIVDIKQMYERWSVGDRPNYAPTNVAQCVGEDLPSPYIPFRYTPPQDTNTPYILFVHGWNMTTEDKDRFAEAAFKRLYWQGYHGRFGVFRWPTEYGFTGTLLQLATSSAKDNFDRSEYTAWRSATGLLNKLNDLNAEYPGHVYLLAHSMGNVVAGEALRLAGNSRVVNTYVASQAAVSAHTYDTNIANYSFNYPPWRSQAVTPNIYGNWLSGNYGGGAGRVVNFYNTNDYALQRSVWQLNQLLKPDQAVAMNGLWDYSYLGPANDPPPWNHFEKSATLGFTIIDFDIVNVLTNRYEVMGLSAESWTTALGATPSVGNVGGNIYLGRITNPRIWLPDPTGNNYAAHFWHSAEFRGDYWQLQGYWSELLGPEAFNLK